ncbi:MAG: diphthine--ammonia ligase [Thermoprotei archaeon]|nr:MAG: diphthine--ammonia ligase [Thermoprotei archaeon]RLF25826.1 MAG: diphthine--ammonia ligase [Thermoprotei archaeon]
MRACVLFSGGKDSTYALHWAFLKGFDIECLVTLEPRREDSWMFHRPAIAFTKLQAEALGLPQIYIETSGIKDKELEDLRNALEIALRKYEVDAIVTGALLSDYQRMNINLIAEELDLRVFSPLWRKDQAEYMLEVVRMGIRFIITSISAYGLEPTFLGRIIEESDVHEIVRRARKYGFNPAFEGGEAETLVLDAPLFRHYRLVVRKGRIVKLGEYTWRYVIEDIGLEEK